MSEKFLEEFRGMCVNLAMRYVPKMFEIPMKLGFCWKLMWTATSVRTRQNPVEGLSRSPFWRSVWDLFALVTWDKAVLLTPTVEDRHVARNRIWPFAEDLKWWSSGYIEPVFTYFAPKRDQYPGNQTQMRATTHGHCTIG